MLTVAVATYRGSLRVPVSEKRRESLRGGWPATPTLSTQLARSSDLATRSFRKIRRYLWLSPNIRSCSIPFILLRLAETHPAWQRDLIRRLHGREFAELFLEHRPKQIERSTDVRFSYSTLFSAARS